MLLASVKLGSSPASEARSASLVHLFRRAAASGEGLPHLSTSRSMLRPSTVALIITRKYAWAESKPSCFALAVNFLRIAGSRGIWIVDVSLMDVGYQRDIIMSRVEVQNVMFVGLEHKIREVEWSEKTTDTTQVVEASLLHSLVQGVGFEPTNS